MLARAGHHMDFVELKECIEDGDLEKLHARVDAFEGRRPLAKALREADLEGTLLLHAASGNKDNSLEIFNHIKNLIEVELEGLDEQLCYVDERGMNLLTHAASEGSFAVLEAVWTLLKTRNFLQQHLQRSGSVVAYAIESVGANEEESSLAVKKLEYILDKIKEESQGFVTASSTHGLIQEEGKAVQGVEENTESLGEHGQFWKDSDSNEAGFPPVKGDFLTRVDLLRKTKKYGLAHYPQRDASPLALAAVLGRSDLFDLVKTHLTECLPEVEELREDLLPTLEEDSFVLTPLLGTVFSKSIPVITYVIKSAEAVGEQPQAGDTLSQKMFVEEVARQLYGSVENSSTLDEIKVETTTIKVNQPEAQAKITVGFNTELTWEFEVDIKRSGFSSPANWNKDRRSVEVVNQSQIWGGIRKRLSLIGNNSEEVISILPGMITSDGLSNPFDTWSKMSVEIFKASLREPRDRTYLRRLRSRIDNLIMELLERLPHTVGAFGAELAGGDPKLNARDLAATKLLGFIVLQSIFEPSMLYAPEETERYEKKGALFWSLQREAKSLSFINAPLVRDFLETAFYQGLPNLGAMRWCFTEEGSGISSQLYSYNAELEDWENWDRGWWGEPLLILLQGRATSRKRKDAQSNEDGASGLCSVLPALQFVLAGAVGRPGGYHPIPAIRLWFEVFSSVVTMVLFSSVVSIEDPTVFPKREVVFYLFIFGIVLREMSEFRQALRIEKQRTAKGILRYFNDNWNFLDILLLSLLSVAFVLRLIALDDTSANPPALFPAQTALAISAPLFFGRTLFLVQINSNMGPMVPIIFAMIWELAQFVVLLFVLMVGFAMAFWALFNPNSSVLLTDYECPAGSLAGSEGFDHPVEEQYGNFIKALGTMFTAMLGEFDFSVFDEYEGCEEVPHSTFGEALLALFLVIMSIMLLNLLIAVLSTAHSKIHSNIEKEAHHSKASIMMHANTSVQEEMLPPPLNLIPVAIGLLIDIPAMFGIVRRPWSESQSWHRIKWALGTFLFACTMGILAGIVSVVLWVISTPYLVWASLSKKSWKDCQDGITTVWEEYRVGQLLNRPFRQCCAKGPEEKQDPVTPHDVSMPRAIKNSPETINAGSNTQNAEKIQSKGLTFDFVWGTFRVLGWLIFSTTCSVVMGCIVTVLYGLLWLRGVWSIVQWYVWVHSDHKEKESKRSTEKRKVFPSGEKWGDWKKAEENATMCKSKNNAEFDIRPFLRRTTGQELKNLHEFIEDPFKDEDGNLWEDEEDKGAVRVGHLRQYRHYAKEDLKKHLKSCCMCQQSGKEEQYW